MTNQPLPRFAGPTLYELVEGLKNEGEIEPTLNKAMQAFGYWDEEGEVNEDTIRNLEVERIDAEKNYAQKYGLDVEQLREGKEQYRCWDNANTLGGLLYRYLNYQFWLDSGNQDKQLLNQQSELLAQIELCSRQLRAVAGEAVVHLGIDLTGIIAHLFSNLRWRLKYGVSNLDKMTEEESNAKWEELYQYAVNCKPLKLVRKIMSFEVDEEFVGRYEEYRYSEHKKLGAVLATLCLDYAYQTNYAESEVFKSDAYSAKVILHKLEENYEDTTYGIAQTCIACSMYDLNVVREGKATYKDLVGHFFPLIESFVKDGGSIRNEHSQ